MKINKEKLKDAIGKIAPAIAGVIGGPFAAAGVAALSQSILGKKDGTEEELLQAISGADTETIARIKEAELAFKARMKELGIQEEALHASDRDSARKREMSVRDKTPMILASMSVLSFVGYVLLITLVGDLPIMENRDLVFFILGQFSAFVVTVYSYYFGSSKGSSSKDETINKFMEK